MTRDIYLARRAVDSQAALALEATLRDVAPGGGRPCVTVAKLRIPQQDISGDDNLERMDALSFTPWRVTAEHRPLGNIMRVRKEVYRHASCRIPAPLPSTPRVDFALRTDSDDGSRPQAQPLRHRCLEHRGSEQGNASQW